MGKLIYGLFIALLSGVVLLLLGLRGRRIDDHPLCRRCGFDLTGKPAGSTRCSECGVELVGPKATRRGNRRRTNGLIYSGIALLLPMLMAIAVVVWARVNDVSFIRYAPLGYVLRQAKSTDPSQHQAAMTEIAARYADGRLAGSSWDRVADAALDAQADMARPWDWAWGTLLETARADRRLSDARWQRYAGQAISGKWAKMDVRPNVTQGDLFPIDLYHTNGRTAATSVLSVAFYRWRLIWDDGTAIDFASHGRHTSPINDFSSLICDCPWTSQTLKAGQHSVRIVADIDVGLPADADRLDRVTTRHFDWICPFLLLPANHASVRMVRDAVATEAIRRGITFDIHQSDSDWVSTNITINNSPMPLAVDVFVRSDGRESKLISFCDSNTSTHVGTFGGASEIGKLHEPCDVIFRSSRENAAGTTDMTTAWDGEIVFKNVPLN